MRIAVQDANVFINLPAVAAEKLRQLLLQDRHLPKSACDERLTRWGNL